jgi:hypothetical protein
MHLMGSGLGSCGFVVIDDATSMPRVAQTVARFLYVESCNQCSACKHGLRSASEALDEIFDPAQASEDDVPRALYGARSAPQGNRCYLPVQGSQLIPSLIQRFEVEFAAQLAAPSAATQPFPIPKLVDFSPGAGFTLDQHQAHKTPDWTYEAPPPAPTPPLSKRARPAERPRDRAHASIGVRLAPDVAEAIEERATVAGRAVDSVVNDALREWLGGR